MSRYKVLMSGCYPNQLGTRQLFSPNSLYLLYHFNMIKRLIIALTTEWPDL